MTKLSNLSLAFIQTATPPENFRVFVFFAILFLNLKFHAQFSHFLPHCFAQLAFSLINFLQVLYKVLVPGRQRG